VYPVGRLDYGASGLIFLTMTRPRRRDAQALEEPSAAVSRQSEGTAQPEQLDAFGKEADARMRVVRQPDAARGHVANFWYEVALKDSKRDELRRCCLPRNIRRKLKRIAIGPLTLEGLPPDITGR